MIDETTEHLANVVMEALKEGRYAAEQGGFKAIAQQIHEAMFSLSKLASSQSEAAKSPTKGEQDD